MSKSIISVNIPNYKKWQRNVDSRKYICLSVNLFTDEKIKKILMAREDEAFETFIWLLTKCEYDKSGFEMDLKFFGTELKNALYQQGQNFNFKKRIQPLIDVGLVTVEVDGEKVTSLYEKTPLKPMLKQSVKRGVSKGENPCGTIYNNNIYKYTEEARKKITEARKKSPEEIKVENDARRIVDFLFTKQKMTVKEGGAGISEQKFFAECALAKKLLRHHGVDDIIAAIEWIVNDRFVGITAVSIGKISSHWNLYTNRKNPDVQKRQISYNKNISETKPKPFAVTQIDSDRQEGIVNVKELLREHRNKP